MQIILYIKNNLKKIILSILLSILSIFIFASIKFNNNSHLIFAFNLNAVRAIIILSLILQIIFLRDVIKIKKILNSEKVGLIHLKSKAFFILLFFLPITIWIIICKKWHMIMILVTALKYLFLFIVNFLISQFLTKYIEKIENTEIGSTEKSTNQNLFTDDPINSFDADSLNRRELVDSIYNIISKYPDNNSLVIGLYGMWGSGKTSIIELLKYKIKTKTETTKDKFWVIDFNPWYFKDKNAILTGFYNELKQKVNKEFVSFKFSRLIKTYLSYISFGTSISIVGLNLSFLNKSQTTEDSILKDLKNEIEELLEKTGKKILIIIDDIDRLQKDEILQIFSMVKNTSNLKNTIFILSFDDSIIKKILIEEFNNEPDKYLEKIIQFPINVPVPIKREISALIKRSTQALLEKVKIDEQGWGFYKKFLDYYDQYMSNLIINLRQAKRYLNALNIFFPAMKSEVNLCDFFIIEFIRVLYPEIYNYIFENRYHYVIPCNTRDITNDINIVGQYARRTITREEEERERKRIAQDIKQIINDDSKSDHINQLFNVLFDQSPEYSEQRIVCFEYFTKYFAFTKSPYQLSDTEIIGIINNWNESKPTEENILNAFEKHKQDNTLTEFLYKLAIFNEKINPELKDIIINTIYRNPDKFSKEQLEYEVALNLLLNLIGEENENENKIKKIVEEAEISFAMDIVINIGIRYKEIINIISSRLEKYIEEKKDIFQELDEKEWPQKINLWASGFGTYTDENKNKVSEYIISICNNPEKFSKFIEVCINTVYTDLIKIKLYSPQKAIEYLEKTYNINEFAIFATKLINKQILSDKEKEILNEFVDVFQNKIQQ